MEITTTQILLLISIHEFIALIFGMVLVYFYNKENEEKHKKEITILENKIIELKKERIEQLPKTVRANVFKFKDIEDSKDSIIEGQIKKIESLQKEIDFIQSSKDGESIGIQPTQEKIDATDEVESMINIFKENIKNPKDIGEVQPNTTVRSIKGSK